MRKKYPKCKVCDPEHPGVIVHDAGLTSEWYEPCPTCNSSEEMDSDDAYEQLKANRE